MSCNHVGKLLWEFIEEKLPPNCCDEARLLVGADLIEQTYELRTEIEQFLAFSGESLPSVRRAVTLLRGTLNEKRISEEEISLFSNLFEHETGFPEKGTHALKAPSSVLVHNPDLNDLIAHLRKHLREETDELGKCLENIQETILNNFVFSDTPAGDSKHTNRVFSTVGVIGHGDNSVKEDTKETKAAQLIETHVKRRGSSNGLRTPNTSASGSSLSNLSAASSTSVSPRTPPQESVSSHGSSSPRIASSPMTKSSRTLHLKNTERLSPSSKALNAVITHSLSRKSGTFSNGNVPMDPKSTVTLPPLNPSGSTELTRNCKSDRRSPIIQANHLIDADLGRFNSAQRFRQMVLRTRQHITETRDSLDGESH